MSYRYNGMDITLLTYPCLKIHISEDATFTKTCMRVYIYIYIYIYITCNFIHLVHF
jgi:hypothetical protein